MSDHPRDDRMVDDRSLVHESPTARRLAALYDAKEHLMRRLRRVNADIAAIQEEASP